MATFTAIQCKKQSASSMRGVIDYVKQEKKTRWGNALLVIGSNCVPQSAFIEMQMTKERFRKTGGTQFYHFVQSFSAEDDITPQEAVPGFRGGGRHPRGHRPPAQPHGGEQCQSQGRAQTSPKL